MIIFTKLEVDRNQSTPFLYFQNKSISSISFMLEIQVVGWIQKKHLLRKRKKVSKKKKKTKHIKIWSSCPVEKSFKKKLSFHCCPLTVFKNSIISFPPMTPRKTRRNHFPHCCTLRTAAHPFPTSEKIYYSFKLNQHG